MMAEWGLPDDAFRHLDHLRLTWLCLRRVGLEAGTQRVAQGIRSFALCQGVPEKYHETLTRVWVRLVAAAAREPAAAGSFASFLKVHPELGDKDYPYSFYRRATLDSPEARAAWVEPDLAPLP